MRNIWIMVGIALLAGAMAIGAIACGSDDDDDNGDGAPVATEEQMNDATATAPADSEPTEANGGEPGASTTVVVTDGVLTTFDGYTLYTFDNDQPGASTCTDTCVENWPPLTVDGDATAGGGADGAVATITRDDGTTQVTYNDQPLYLYSGDFDPGDRAGDGVGGVWHVVTVE